MTYRPLVIAQPGGVDERGVLGGAKLASKWDKSVATL